MSKTVIILSPLNHKGKNYWIKEVEEKKPAMCCISSPAVDHKWHPHINLKAWHLAGRSLLVCEPCSRLHVCVWLQCWGFSQLRWVGEGGWQPQANTKLKEKEVAVTAVEKKHKARQMSSERLFLWLTDLIFWPPNQTGQRLLHERWQIQWSLAGGCWAKWGLVFTLAVRLLSLQDLFRPLCVPVPSG